MNEPVLTWCREHGLEVIRARAYRKNDHAWVEQKNGAIVRRLVGYGRLEGLASAQALVRLYAATRLHTNLFQPSFKLKHKTRIGARVIKRYHAPAIPAARVLAHPAVAEESKEALRPLQAQSDPVQLITEIPPPRPSSASGSTAAGWTEPTCRPLRWISSGLPPGCG